MTRTSLFLVLLAGCGWRLAPPSVADAPVVVPDGAVALDAGDPPDAAPSDAIGAADLVVLMLDEATRAPDAGDPPDASAADVVTAVDVPPAPACTDGGVFARNVSCDTALPLEPGAAHADTLCGAPAPTAAGCACAGCVQTFYSVVNYAGVARPVRITTSAGVVATTDDAAWPGCFADPPPVWTCASADVTVMVAAGGSAGTYRFAIIAPPGLATVTATFE